MTIDFGLTANDYAKHRAGFPRAFFERVFDEGIVKAGNSLVDLGTGTGTLARGFAARGCKVTGLDVSAQMLEQARELSRQAGLDAEFRAAPPKRPACPIRLSMLCPRGNAGIGSTVHARQGRRGGFSSLTDASSSRISTGFRSQITLLT